jgi:hypothetical protein
MQKTISGKKCPKCSSFIKAGQAQCSVCGFDFEMKNEPAKEEPELPVTIKTGSNNIICPKCRTQNNPEFKFCKICKHPLQEVTLAKNKPAKKLRLNFNWLSAETGENFLKEEDFSNCRPYFDGCLQWEGYTFCAFKKKYKFEILVRKTGASSHSLLYKKCSHVYIEISGNQIFLGAVKMKLMGDMNPQTEQQTMVNSDKTLFVGPGESLHDNPAQKGLPRLKICEMSLKKDTVELKKRTLLGRDFLARHTDLDHEVMRKNGISNEHVYLTPLQGSRWLIEPLPNKSIFVEINEEPVVLHKDDILRLAADHQVGEFKINVMETLG